MSQGMNERYRNSVATAREKNLHVQSQGEMPKHSLSFVFNNPKIPAEVGILSKNKKNPHRRSPFHGMV